MADPSVSVKLTLQGENRAGGAIKQAEAQASQLAAKMSTVAERSGDVERGFLGLKDIASNLSPQAQVIADVAGGLEGMIKGLGGLFGPVGLAIGAIGAAAAGVYAIVKQNEKEALETRAKYLELLADSPKLILQHYGVSKDVLEVEKQTFDLAASRTKLIATANEALALEAKLQRDLAEGNDAEVSAGRVRLADARNRVEALAEEVRLDQTLQLQRNMRSAEAIRNEIALAAESQRIAQIADDRVRLAEQERVAQRELVKIETQLAQVRSMALEAEVAAQLAIITGNAKEQEAAAERMRKAADKLKALSSQQLAEQQKLFQVGKDRDALEAQRQQQAQQRAQKATAARQKAEQDRQRQEQESDRVSKELADRFVANIGRRITAIKQEREFAAARDKAFADAQQEVRDAQIDAATDPARRAELEYLEKRRKLMERLQEVQRDGTMEARTAAAQQFAITTRLATLETERVNQLAEARAQARDAAVTQAGQIADATIQGLSMIDGAQKAAAATKAVLAVAEGLYAVATQGVAGIPQLIAGIAAGAQFALASGSSAPQVPSGIGGGGQQTPRDLGPRMEPQRNVVINVTGAVIGTPQQVGLQVQKAAKSLTGTGYPAKAGA